MTSQFVERSSEPPCNRQLALPVGLPKLAVSVNGDVSGPAVAEAGQRTDPGLAYRTEYEQNRRTAYAAVTAGFEADGALIARLVCELVEQPADAADALLALIHTCGAMVELWANATDQEPIEAWAKYARTTALVVSQATDNGDEG